MFDIRWIRENAVAFDQALAKRGYEASAAKLIALDDSRRSHITKLQEAQERRNAASKEIGKAKGSGDDARARELIDEVAQIKAFIQSGEEEERKLIADLEAAMTVIPNLPGIVGLDVHTQGAFMDIGPVGPLRLTNPACFTIAPFLPPCSQPGC